jgi:DNA-binding response OmpR family regulator
MNKKKILIVDDDQIFLDELKEALRHGNFDIEYTTNASEVVKIADNIKPDLILLDMKIEGKDGFQVADDLCNFPGTKHIPIIAMTGYFTEKRHKAFMKSIGIRDCIYKPFNPAEVIFKIDVIIGASPEYACQSGK